MSVDAPLTTRKGGGFRGQARLTLWLLSALSAAMAWWLLSLRQRPDVDLWLHLRIGQSLRNGVRFQVLPDPLVALADQPYVPSQWLAEVVGSVAYSAGGMNGVHALRWLAIVVVAASLWGSARLSSSPNVSTAIMILTLFCTSTAWGERPQLAGLALEALTVFLWSRTLGGAGPPWLVVPVTWLWAMIHGSWIIGVATSSLFVVAVALQRPRQPRRWTLLLAVPIASVATAALTPLGPGLHMAPFEVGAAARTGVNEWQRPALDNPFFVLVILMAVAVVVVSARRAACELPAVALALGGAVLALAAVRTVAFGAVLMAPALAMVMRSRAPSPEGPPYRDLLPLLAAVGVLAFLPGVIWGGPTQGPLSPTADEALERLPAGTRVAVEPYSSGWVLWAHPSLRVLKDLRAEVYSARTTHAYDAFMEASPGWQVYAEQHDVGAVVTEAGSPMDAAMSGTSDWSVAERDQDRTVWVRQEAPASSDLARTT